MKILNKNKLINIGLFFISLVFLTLPFENSSLKILILFALVPFLILLKRIKSLKSAFLVSWFLGILFLMLETRWFFNVFSSDVIGVGNDSIAAFVFLLYWIVISVVPALNFALFGYIIKKIKVLDFKILALIFTISSIWILSEYFRTFIYSIVSWGEGALVGTHWTFGHLGYLLADTPMFYFGRVAGLYGLSFIIIMINVFIYLFISNKNDHKKLIYTFITIFFIFTGIYLITQFFINYKYKINEEKNIKVLSLGIPNVQNFLYREGFLDLLKEMNINKNNQPDIVVFPEGFYLLSIYGDLEKPIFKILFPDISNDGYIVANNIKTNNGKKISQIIYRDNQGNIVGNDEKLIIIPGGETMPFFVEKIMTFLKLEDRIKKFEISRKISKTSMPIKSNILGDVSVGTFPCSGVFSPNYSRELIRQGAEILINSASHNFFRNHPRISYELELMARFEAMANNRPLIQSTYGGPALIIDKNGDIIKKSSLEKSEILLEEIYSQRKMTLTSKLGDTPIILLGLLIVIFFRIKIKRF